MLPATPTFPYTPQLHAFSSTGRIKAFEDCRYLYLANLLHRHHRQLARVTLGLSHSYQETMPEELPCCKALSLTGPTAVS